jgi:hypothetical protein
MINQVIPKHQSVIPTHHRDHHNHATCHHHHQPPPVNNTIILFILIFKVVPADCEWVEGDELAVDTSALTGESLPRKVLTAGVDMSWVLLITVARLTVGRLQSIFLNLINHSIKSLYQPIAHSITPSNQSTNPLLHHSINPSNQSTALHPSNQSSTLHHSIQPIKHTPSIHPTNQPHSI